MSQASKPHWNPGQGSWPKVAGNRDVLNEYVDLHADMDDALEGVMLWISDLEEQVAVLQHEVEILNEQSDGWQIEASRLEEQHEALTHERDFLREENAGKDSEVRVLEEQFGAAQAALREIAATDWFNGEDRFAGPDDIARSALASFPATSSAPDRNAGAEVPLREAIEKALGYTAGSELPEEIESLLSNPASSRLLLKAELPKEFE